MNLPRALGGAPMVALLLALLLTSCDDTTESSTARMETPHVTVVARDYSYEMPDQIRAGTVRMTLQNEGPEPHHAQVARLKDGVTLEQFTAELQQRPEAAVQLLTHPGGPALVAPGGSQDVTLNLTAGTYVMLCFVPSPDGVPHVAKGMVKPFQVTVSPEQKDAPAAENDVTLRDFAFTLPPIRPGDTTLKVTNAGPQPHEMVIVKPAEGMTIEDIATFLRQPAGPPPFTPAGGMQTLDPGAGGWLTLDLAPGTYVAVCAVPDPASGRPHADLGMIQQFTIQ